MNSKFKNYLLNNMIKGEKGHQQVESISERIDNPLLNHNLNMPLSNFNNPASSSDGNNLIPDSLKKMFEETKISFGAIGSIKKKNNKFGLQEWAQFQKLLKEQHNLIQSEMKYKNNLIQEIADLTLEYNTLILKLRDLDELIKKNLENRTTSTIDEILKFEPIKSIFDCKTCGLSDAYTIMKSFLFILRDNPKLLSNMLNYENEIFKLKGLEETICTTFYQCLNFENESTLALSSASSLSFNSDFMALLSELLKMEFENTDNIKKLFSSGNFIDRILSAYLKSNECKKYAKSILKNLLIQIIQNPNLLLIDSKSIKAILAKNKNLKSTNIINNIRINESFVQFPSKSPSLKQNIPDYTLNINQNISNKKCTIVPGIYKEYLEQAKLLTQSQNENIGRAIVGIPRFIENQKQIYNEEPDDFFEVMEDCSEIPIRFLDIPKHSEILNQNPEVNVIYNQNLKLIREYLDSFMNSLFEKFSSMPIGIKIVCKLLGDESKKKFPLISKKELNCLIGNFLLTKWLIPFFVCPSAHGILEEYKSTPNLEQNLIELGKIFKKIFLQELYDTNDALYELNNYILAIKPSIERYYDELMDTNNLLLKDDNLIQDSSNTINNDTNIKLRAICISLNEIKFLVDCVNNNKEKVMMIMPSLVNLADKINYYQAETGIFSPKIHPITKKKIELNCFFILFDDLIFPKKLSLNYIDEFDKLIYSTTVKNQISIKSNNDIIPQQLQLNKIKSLLKELLISLEDITKLDDISLLSDDDILIQILTKYGDDDMHSLNKNNNDYDHNQQLEGKLNSSIYLACKFILSNLDDVDYAYKKDNHKKLYESMLIDFKNGSNILLNHIKNTKLQLLNMINSIQKGCNRLRKIYNNKQISTNNSYIRKFMENLNIPLCILNPNTRKNLPKLDKKSSFELNNKFILNYQKECLHQKESSHQKSNSQTHSFSLKNTNITKESINSYRSNLNLSEKAMMDYSVLDKKGHFNTVFEFVEIISNLDEIKEILKSDDNNDNDLTRINELYNEYLDIIFNITHHIFKYMKEDEWRYTTIKIENYLTKRLYTAVYPKEEGSNRDREFHRRCILHQWINYSHLEIADNYKCQRILSHAIEVFNEIDKKHSVPDKLNCIMECFTIITEICILSSGNNQSGSADETLPMFIFIIIKAAPKRLHSNIKFISAFHHSQKMLAGEGYCFIQLKSAISFIEKLNSRALNVDKNEYEQKIKLQMQNYDFSLNK